MTAQVMRAVGGTPVAREDVFGAPVRSPRPSLLAKPLDANARTREAAAVLGIQTVGDLLEHVPAGHEFRAVRTVAQLKPGDEATIEVVVRSIAPRPTRRRNFRIVEALVADASGSVKAIWFNQAYLAKQLPPGTSLRLFGQFKRGAMQVREHSVLDRGAAPAAGEAKPPGAPAPASGG
ncbi:MAG: hypothetical protein JJE27_08400, partial [Thermoleophilia bacterium]|nr:hypothetical protein [Thermoleophilia bacterium]